MFFSRFLAPSASFLSLLPVEQRHTTTGPAHAAARAVRVSLVAESRVLYTLCARACERASLRATVWRVRAVTGRVFLLSSFAFTLSHFAHFATKDLFQKRRAFRALRVAESPSPSRVSAGGETAGDKRHACAVASVTHAFAASGANERIASRGAHGR